MKKFCRKWIKMNEEVQDHVSENTIEEKEEEKMNFFSKHKKGLIIGGLGALAAGAAGLFLASRKDDSEDGYEEDFDDDFDDDEVTEEAGSEESEA